MARRLLLVAVVIFTAALLYGDTGARGSFNRSLQVNGPVEMHIENASGAIHVHSGGAGTVSIHADIHARHNDDSDKVRRLEQNPPIAQSGNTINIGQNLDADLRRDVGINYEIVVPADTRLEVHTGSGAEEITGIKGPVNARTGSGAVRISGVSGEVTVNTGSGSMQLEDIGTLVRAHSGSGAIHASLVGKPAAKAGPIDVETGSGSIELENVRGALRARTGSGHIDVRGEPGGNWEVHTGSGGVELHLPSDAAFDLQAHTGSGRITVDHPITMQGQIGNRHRVEGKVRGGGPLLEVSTGSGGIHIASGGSQPL